MCNPNTCVYVGVGALLQGEYELLPVRGCCQCKEQKRSGFCYGREKAVEWPLEPWRNQQSGDLSDQCVFAVQPRFGQQTSFLSEELSSLKLPAFSTELKVTFSKTAEH